MDDDLYAVLGVDRRASSAEIKRAYRRLAVELHPDRHPDDPEAEARFRRINVAYHTLVDPQRRARYDAERLRTELSEFSPKSAVTVAREFVGGVVGDLLGTRRKAARRGRDVRYTLTVEFAEAVLGTSKTITFDGPVRCPTCEGAGSTGSAPVDCDHCDGRGELRSGPLGRRVRCPRCDGTGLVHRDPCRTCRGTGRVTRQVAYHVAIPPGTESGSERVLEGRGEPGRFGGPPGDLRITVNVRPDPDMRREGRDIVARLYVSPVEASTGALVPAPCVHGPLSVRLPEGVETGTKLRVRGKGVPGSGGRGDAIFEVVVETPRRPSHDRAAAAAFDAAAAAFGTVLDDHTAACTPRRAEQRGRIEARHFAADDSGSGSRSAVS
ncbi:MAG: J domain-containing protein [Deltaproteobacteria bacterium]|nr:MAG: J domain-containing protein [Deltaproteobacteria bacterium]